MTVIFAVTIVAVAIFYKHATQIDPPKPRINSAGLSNASTVRVGRLPGSTARSSSMQPLGKSLDGYLRAHGDNNDSSVYIEDLSNHVMVNVGTTNPYNSKSLMKTPLAMTLYKASELGRLNLDEPKTITDSELDPNYGGLFLAGAGSKITLREATKDALALSDNTAIHVVSDYSMAVMPRDERSYVVLNLDLQTDENMQTFITARSYATIFRCLYTACYNNRQDSDELLQLMEHTEFSDPSKLLPKNIVVSHKIGDNGDMGYNDCGIVFGPKKPFIFCIMLDKGAKQAGNDISQIVKLSYDFLEK